MLPAIAGQAQVIVTNNIRDFPASATEPVGVQVLEPDEFLASQFEVDPRRAMASINRQANELRSVGSGEELLAVLDTALPQFVAVVRSYRRVELSEGLGRAWESELER